MSKLTRKERNMGMLSLVYYVSALREKYEMQLYSSQNDRFNDEGTLKGVMNDLDSIAFRLADLKDPDSAAVYYPLGYETDGQIVPFRNEVDGNKK